MMFFKRNLRSELGLIKLELYNWQYCPTIGITKSNNWTTSIKTKCLPKNIIYDWFHRKFNEFIGFILNTLHAYEHSLLVSHTAPTFIKFVQNCVWDTYFITK